MSGNDRLYVQVYAHLRDRVERRWVGAGALNSFVNRKLAEALGEVEQATREDVANLTDAELALMTCKLAAALRSETAAAPISDESVEGEVWFSYWMVADEAAARLASRRSIWSWTRGKK